MGAEDEETFWALEDHGAFAVRKVSERNVLVLMTSNYASPASIANTYATLKS